jgi:hypothetical protein
VAKSESSPADKQRRPWQVEGEELLPASVQTAIDDLLRHYGEIPDRTSPNDFPEGYVLTRREIVAGILEIIEADRIARSAELAITDEQRVLDAICKASGYESWFIARDLLMFQRQHPALEGMLQAIPVHKIDFEGDCSNCRRLAHRIEKIDKALDEAGAPLNGDWDGLTVEYSQVGRIKRLAERTPLSATEQIKQAGRSLVEDIMDDAQRLKEHAPKELHAMIDGIYYRAQNSQGSFS